MTGLARWVLAGVCVVALASAVGCTPQAGLLGGRETCWPETEQRVASLWRGTLRIDATSGHLDTPEGDTMPLWPGELELQVDDLGLGHLVHGAEVVATSGQDVTLFGGVGADGSLVVCGVEAVHG